MGIHWHTIWTVLFGWPSTWGAGGNMVAWVICGAISFGWLRAKLHAHHVALLAQAARHHREQLDQAAEHHKALMLQANRHQLQVLDQAKAHHEAMKTHVAKHAPSTVVLGDELAKQVATVLKREPGLTGPLRGKAAKDG